jgi:hypothetical protein
MLRKTKRIEAMEPFQWFLLGAIAAWLPGMLILLICLCSAPPEERVNNLDDEHGKQSSGLPEAPTAARSRIARLWGSTREGYLDLA